MNVGSLGSVRGDPGDAVQGDKLSKAGFLRKPEAFENRSRRSTAPGIQPNDKGSRAKSPLNLPQKKSSSSGRKSKTERKGKEKGAAGLPFPPEGEKKESPADGRTTRTTKRTRANPPVATDPTKGPSRRTTRQFRAALKSRFIKLKSAPGTARTSRERSQWRPNDADG